MAANTNINSFISSSSGSSGRTSDLEKISVKIPSIEIKIKKLLWLTSIDYIDMKQEKYKISTCSDTDGNFVDLSLKEEWIKDEHHKVQETENFNELISNFSEPL